MLILTSAFSHYITRLWFLLVMCICTGGAGGAGGAATTTSQAVMQAQQSRSSKKINYDALKVHITAIHGAICIIY